MVAGPGARTNRGLISRPRCPPALAAILPTDTQAAWKALAPVLPQELYLAGGTAVAVHLHHRASRDLDFFYHRAAVDVSEVERNATAVGRFAVERREPGTLGGLFGATKIEFFHADEAETQRLLEPPLEVAGLRVAGLRDLMAMKLKVVREGGDLRDYYDIKEIEERAGLQVEDGLALFIARYELTPQNPAIAQVVQALGYLDDIEDDQLLPITKQELAAWWVARQPRLVKHLARNPLR